MKKNFFDQYIKNWERKNELDELITKPAAKEEWLAALKERSAEIRKIYAENEILIAELADTLKHVNDEGFPQKAVDNLYDGIINMYYADCDDIHVMSMLLDTLIEYYTKCSDYSKLVNLYAVRFYQKIELLDRLSKNVPAQSIIEDAVKIFEYQTFYKDLSLEARRKIFSTYYNVAVVCLDNEKIDVEKSYRYLNDLDNFWKSTLVQDMDRDDERIQSIPDRTKKEWLGFCEDILDAPDSIKEFYISLSDEFYNSEKKAGKEDYEISYETYVSHITALCLKNTLSWDEGFKALTDYYIQRRDYLKENHENNDKKLSEMSFDYMDYLYFFINLPQTLVAWIDNHSISPQHYNPYVEMYLEDLHEMWDELYSNLPNAFLDTFVMTVALNIISYKKDMDFQREWISKLLVKRDVATCIHSTMVSNLATEIASDMIKNKPELFLGVYGYDANKVKENANSLLDFIKNAAYMHDIGKTRIGDIINMQIRKIDDIEFNIIKNHPREGANLTELLEALVPYRDVILGHHKYYDGTKGYPEDFDNTSSNVRAVIDLITICDCIDAATDLLGRNYAEGKSSDTVIKEIFDERSTRYNPMMAEYIYHSQTLREKIKYLTEEGRMECNYQILTSR